MTTSSCGQIVFVAVTAFSFALLLQNHPCSSTSSATEAKAAIMNGEKTVKPKRIWGDQCTKSDIEVSQGTGLPLPNGIPTYMVEISNLCLKGCSISSIHLSCGWFSSARLINPKVFKRIRYNDCLLNDGKTLCGGHSISFQYANSFHYPLSVSSIKIIC